MLAHLKMEMTLWGAVSSVLLLVWVTVGAKAMAIDSEIKGPKSHGIDKKIALKEKNGDDAVGGRVLCPPTQSDCSPEPHPQRTLQ